MKNNLKEIAIDLRKQGLSYREIMQQIPVAKSTISDWLHSVQLAQHQKQRLTEKKLAAIKRGGAAKHQQRVDRTKLIIEKAKSEIGSISKRELWLMGVMLYWAEGSKEKMYGASARTQFTNMDPFMIGFFLFWLENICGIQKTDLIFEISIHETHRHRIEEIIDYWSKIVGVSRDCFSRIYFKKANIKTKRKNIGETYFGVFRIRVRSSASLNRRIAGWTQGVVESFRSSLLGGGVIGNTSAFGAEDFRFEPWPPSNL